MIKWKKAAAVLLSALSVFSFAAAPISNLNVSAKQADYVEQFNDLSRKTIVLDSSKGADEEDVLKAINQLGNSMTGRTLKLVGKFTVTQTWRLRRSNVIDATDAVISGNADIFLSSYDDDNITVKGGIWNLGSASRLAKISTSTGSFVFDSMTVNGGGDFEYGVFMISNVGADNFGVSIQNCKFKNIKSQAVFVYRSKNINLVNNSFDNIDGHGIYVYSSENVNVFGNKMNGIRGDAVKYCSSKNVNISGNNIQKVTRHPKLDIDPLRTTSRSGCGLLISECQNIKVGKAYVYNGKTYEGNTVVNCENYGIHINLSDNTYVDKSVFTDIGSDGIHNSASSSTTIRNSTFKNCKEKGLFFIPGPVDSVKEKLRNCQNAVISGNNIDNCGSFGIMLSKTKGTSLTQNTVKNCKDYGIYFNECENGKSVDDITINTKTSKGSGIGNNNSKNIVIDSKLTLDKTSLSLGKGESYSLQTTNNTVKWSTSNSKVATVSGGKVSAKGNGTAIITAKTSSGKTATCKITVRSAPDWVTISKKTLTLGVGETYQLSAAIPSNASAAVRTFRTSNSSIVKMTKTNWQGQFKAIKPGTAWVTVRLYNGKEASCKITVKKAPTWVTVDKKVINMKVGQTSTLSATIAKDAGCATRTFRTSNSSIVKMTKTNWQGQFKAVRKGTAWVTVRLYNGKESSCKVVVS